MTKTITALRMTIDVWVEPNNSTAQALARVLLKEGRPGGFGVGEEVAREVARRIDRGFEIDDVRDVEDHTA